MSKTINEQTIINRHSVRTYQTTPITTYHQQELLNFIDHLENPWNIKIKITFINDIKDTDKIGTYEVKYTLNRSNGDYGVSKMFVVVEDNHE